MSEAAVTEEVKNYTEDDVKSQLKPLSENGFLRFFQKIWRWWLGVWYGFVDKHPKLSSWIYKLFFFIVFSEGVTIWQLLVMLFLPKAFAGLSGTFAWPGIVLGDMTWLQPILVDGAKEFLYTEEPVAFSIFGDTAGLGNWIAFEIAVFTAQCINFPLQRNITFRSHGNPWYQAMWYFIGWVAISFFTGALWGIIDPFLKSWGWYYTLNDAGLLVENGGLYFLATLLKTVITGGLSMAVFFPIFILIFPDNNKKAKSAKEKYEKLKAENAPAEQIAKAEANMKLWEDKALKSNAEKDFFKAKSQVNAKVMNYLAIKKAAGKAETEEQKTEYAAKVEKNFNDAVEAIKLKDEKEAAFNAAMAQ